MYPLKKEVLLIVIIQIACIKFEHQPRAQQAKNIHAIGVTTGATAFGQIMTLSHLTYFTPLWYFKASGVYVQEKNRMMSHSAWGWDLMLGRIVFISKSSPCYNISIVGGSTTSLESGRCRGGDCYSFQSNKTGVLLGMEMGCYIRPRWSVLLHIDQRFVGIDKQAMWGYRRWSAMGGISYHFSWKSGGDQKSSDTEKTIE